MFTKCMFAKKMSCFVSVLLMTVVADPARVQAEDPGPVEQVLTEPQIFEIGEIPGQTVWHGDSLQFSLKASSLGSGASFRHVAQPAPAGPITLDAQAGVFGYTPASADRFPFNVTVKAGADVSQTFTITPMVPLPPEATVIGLNTVQPVPDAASRDYVVVHETKRDSQRSWNHKVRTTRSISVAGNEVWIAQGHPQGLHAYHENDDITDFSIYAETLVVASPFHLPQTTVTIYARHLRFEGNGYIDTTPRSLGVRPDKFKPGADGLNAGDIDLFIADFESTADRSIRFMLNGGNGQAGGLGQNGARGASMSLCPDKTYRDRRSIYLLSNNGGLSFTTSGRYAAAEQTGETQLVDVDSDGDLDIVSLGTQPGSGGFLSSNKGPTYEMWVLRNNGHGVFGTPQRYGLPGFQGLTVNDLDADGYPDVMLGIGEAGPGILWNQRDGTFSVGRELPDSYDSQPCAVADFDGNGTTDIVALAYSSQYRYLDLYLNRGDRTFPDPQRIRVSSKASSVAAADLDGDSDIDLAILYVDSRLFHHKTGVDVYINRGDGTFSSGPSYSHPSWFPGKIDSCADLDGNGFPDLLVTHQSDNTLLILFNNGSGSFSATTTYNIEGGVSAIAPTDIDSDGDIDLVISPDYYSDVVRILRNDGNGVLADGPQISFASNSYPTARAGDLTSDGHPDLLVHTWYPTLMSVTNITWVGFVRFPEFTFVRDICGDRTKWPEDGKDAIPGGKPGEPGNGGTLRSSVALSADFEARGGKAGDGSTARGGEPGTPVPARRVYLDWQENQIVWIDEHSARRGSDASSPSPSMKEGQPGQVEYGGHNLSWLTPFALRSIMLCVKDAYRAGHRGIAQSMLTDYTERLAEYQVSSAWADVPAKWQLDFGQLEGEMATLLHRLSAGLDYYGNPPGWVPMLSFETTLSRNAE